MYEWVNKMTELACPPLKIREFTIEEEKMWKAEIDEADVRPNFAKGLLQEGFVEMPVYRNELIAPLGRGGKFCDYTVKTYGIGNLVEITQSYGKLELNEQDNRYVRRDSSHEVRLFRFYYNDKANRYKQENNEQRWEQRVKEANELLYHEEVEKLLRGFLQFYHDFWIDRGTFLYQNKLTPVVFVADLQAYCHLLWYRCEDMSNFFTLLHVFGGIPAQEKDVLVESLNRLKAKIDELQLYLNEQVFIHGKEPDWVYHDHEHNYRLRKLEDSIKIVFQPAFYVDATQEQLYRNVGQYYALLKPTKHFCNADTMKEMKEQLIEQAKKAMAIKGKQTVASIDDLEIAFVEL
ncbi:hypothetical protein J19TS2_17340 [Cohnella xylanilytica]|uniref:hypothetical protein n=1 Tax=Cohnella xylanilytica TaxID=557555 RepID=UPI001B26353A|nr:hypothetical protein [Cohnella xylanilytica]GIO12179.1 hypothetical protein J19TS2_17340 [Cohnella xylanilytica]